MSAAILAANTACRISALVQDWERAASKKRDAEHAERAAFLAWQKALSELEELAAKSESNEGQEG